MPRTLRDLLPPLAGKWKVDGIAFGEYPKGPDGRNLCRWCHLQVPTRKKQQVWCGQECVGEHALAKGSSGPIRIAVLDRDKGVCAACGLDCDAFGKRMVKRLRQAKERGLGGLRPNLDDEARETLVRLANGDARTALNALELATSATAADDSGAREISAATIEDAMQQRAVLYDKAGDQHYDTISALIKSVRGSDPDAAIYWLARMIEAGEDAMYIARRLVVLASEDIGMADPQALQVAVAAQQAVHLIGMPEGRIPLAEVTVYLATAPKSNSAYMAIDKALEDTRRTRNDPVPLHLRNAVTGLMRDMDYGKGYKYSHDYEGHFTPMQNLPDSLKGRRYYTPTDQGYEQQVADRLRKWWGSPKEEPGEDPDGDRA